MGHHPGHQGEYEAHVNDGPIRVAGIRYILTLLTLAQRALSQSAITSKCCAVTWSRVWSGQATTLSYCAVMVRSEGGAYTKLVFLGLSGAYLPMRKRAQKQMRAGRVEPRREFLLVHGLLKSQTPPQKMGVGGVVGEGHSGTFVLVLAPWPSEVK